LIADRRVAKCSTRPTPFAPAAKAPTKADYQAFVQGRRLAVDPARRALFEAVAGRNIPVQGAIVALRAAGHRLVPLTWAAASPSAHVTEDAFERIVGDLIARLKSAGRLDGVYLDLHGAMVTEHHDDGEGELLRRVREVVGPNVPVVASLDLHANVTRADGRACRCAVRLPHLSARRHGRDGRARRRPADAPDLARAPLRQGVPAFDFLTGPRRSARSSSPARVCTTCIEPPRAPHAASVLSFAPGFPMADFDECGMSVVGYSHDEARRKAAVAELAMRSPSRARFRARIADPDEAVQRASARGAPGRSGRARRHPGQSGRGRQRRHDRACWRRCCASARPTRCSGC
jgi:microcystin degradation protein MlrC